MWAICVAHGFLSVYEKRQEKFFVSCERVLPFCLIKLLFSQTNCRDKKVRHADSLKQGVFGIGRAEQDSAGVEVLAVGRSVARGGGWGLCCCVCKRVFICLFGYIFCEFHCSLVFVLLKRPEVEKFKNQALQTCWWKARASVWVCVRVCVCVWMRKTLSFALKRGEIVSMRIRTRWKVGYLHMPRNNMLILHVFNCGKQVHMLTIEMEDCVRLSRNCSRV